MKSATLRIAICGVAFSSVGPLFAHHSATMFDHAKAVEISGTVKAWQFVNPHSWLQVMVTGPDGKVTQWSFEGAGSGGGAVSTGGRMSKDLFKPGEKVTVKTYLMKDGRPAGTLTEVTFADGRVWPTKRPAAE